MEYTLFETPKCHVFKLPPKKSAAGYKAEEWEGHNIWSGQCKVVSTDEQCFIRLVDDAGKLFAECPISNDPNAPKSIENVTDSSRYYVIRVENKEKGQHAFIGIGFDERSQAFDFSVALSDFKKSVQQAKERAEKGDYVAKDFGDLGLKSGEKITVNLGGKIKTGEKVNEKVGVIGKPTGGLAPPPGRSGLAPPPGRAGTNPPAAIARPGSPQAGPPNPVPVQQQPVQQQAPPPMDDFFGAKPVSAPLSAQPQQDLFGSGWNSAPLAPAPAPAPKAPAGPTNMDDLFKF
jgi:hypothetical protein